MLKGFSSRPVPASELEIRPMIEFVKNLNKPNLIGVEIGVLHGFNALAILRTLSISKLYLVDPYKIYDAYLDIKTPFAYRAEKDAKDKLAPFPDKITWIRKFSSEAKDEIPDELDFVYIDGNHAYEFVKEDIKNYWPKIKKGGVLGGHDYYNMFLVRQVKKAVDEFIAENKLELHAPEGPKFCDWWVVK